MPEQVPEQVPEPVPEQAPEQAPMALSKLVPQSAPSAPRAPRARSTDVEAVSKQASRDVGIVLAAAQW